MSLDHTPLDPGTLGPEAQRALGNPMTRMMAARGLAPISNPRELVAVLYQLALDVEEKIRLAASASVGELPEAIVRAGVGDPAQDPRVLDFLAGRYASSPDLLELVARNPAAHPATIARLAATGTERLCDLIADNQERLLASPDIISALYGNRQARMSTVDRVVELAVRTGVKVVGIAAWDELVVAYSSARSAPAASAAAGPATSAGEIVEVDANALDAAFRKATAAGDAVAPGDEKEKEVEVWALPVPMKIRLATLGNAFDRSILIRDPKKIVSIAVIKSPGVSESEAAKYAGNSGLSEEVIAYIANKREWTKLYGIKLALVKNPKCSMAASMRLLVHLRDADITAVSRSKGVPSALAAQARKLMQNKMGGKG